MTDLFTGGDHTPDADTNYLEVLVGDGKKFKTVEDLARGKAEADAFIQRLKDEQDALRQELATRKRLEDIVDHLGAPKSPAPVTPIQSNQDDEGAKPRDAVTTPNFEELVEKALTKKEQEKRQTANVEEVKRTLSEAWGSSFAQQLAQQAQALDMTKEQLNTLAATNPKAFFRLVGVGQPTRQNDLFTAPTSQVNSNSFSPQTNNVRNKAYYDKIKKDNPSEYWKPATQNQMHKDAVSLKDRFFT